MKLLMFALSVVFGFSGLLAQTPSWQPSPGHTQMPIWPGAVPDARPFTGPETVRLKPFRVQAGWPTASERNDLDIGNVAQRLQVADAKGALSDESDLHADARLSRRRVSWWKEMFQDLHVVDFHAHFPIKGDVSTSGVGIRQYAAGTPAAEQAAYMRAQAERYRAAWRLAWDFPEPDPEAAEQPLETVADRWLAELDRYGIDRIGFATGGGNDTLARAVARHPDRFIGFAHHNPFAPGATDELRRAVTELKLRGLKILAPALERRIDDRDLYPLWEAVEDLGVPVLIHFGMLGAGGGISWNERDNLSASGE